jgi:hypothetical protein
MKPTNSLLISVLGLAALLALGLVNKVDVSGPISALCASYIASRSMQKASGVWASSKDLSADTVAALKLTEGKDV